MRLLRIRNPHACGEWTGEWSDQSEMWAQLVDGGGGGGGGFGGASGAEALPLCPYGARCYRQSAQHRAAFRHAPLPADHAAGGGGHGQSAFERTGVDDGTFWIEYTQFLMGFSHVDVCYAMRGWHARSFDNYFPAERKAARRVCASLLEVTSAERPATLMVTLTLTPTQP